LDPLNLPKSPRRGWLHPVAGGGTAEPSWPAGILHCLIAPTRISGLRSDPV